MDEFATWASLVLIATQVTSLIKYLSAGQVRSFITGVIPVVGLFVVLAIASQSDAAAGVVIPGFGVPLDDVDVASLALLALAGGSGGSQLHKTLKAVDGRDTAIEPTLGGRP